MVPAPQDERPVVSVGMLGYGFMGKAHSNALLTLPYMFWPGAARVDLRVIGGRTEEKVREAATRYGWSHYTTDWRDIVDDPDVAVFDNVSADAAHYEPTLAAIRAGKHVVCEKPLAQTLAQALELEQAAVAGGTKHMTCFNYRFMPAVRLAHDMIANGDLGEIFSAEFRYAQEWRTDPTSDLPTTTGALQVIGVHAIDQARYLVGEIHTVSAVVTNPVTTSERAQPVDTVAAVVQFDSGASGTIGASLISPGRKNMLGWEINGSKGSLRWDLEQLNLLRVHRRGAPLEGFTDVIVCEAEHPLVGPWWPSGHILGWEHGHINMWAHFIEAVVNDDEVGPEAATFTDGAQAARVAEAIMTSSTSKERTSVAGIG